MADNHFKINRGLSLVGQASAPSNPTNGDIYYDSTLAKFRKYENGAWSNLGSGGSGGVNFVGMTTAWSPDNTDDVNAETSVGNWAAYADAAGIAPVDMTGGSPNTTIARTTTVGEVLNGSAAFKITKGAANRQGEGVSVVANIPLGYRNSNLAIQIPFKIISGSLAEGDLDLYVYDVTNSQVITPFNKKVVGSQGVLSASFQVLSTTAQIRVGFHFASTSATAVTLSFDDVFVGPMDIAMGMAGSDTVAWTPTGTWNTNVTYSGVWCRQGEFMLGQIAVVLSGAPNATTLNVNLPGVFQIDTAKSLTSATITNAITKFGDGEYRDAGTATYDLDVVYAGTTALQIRAREASSTYTQPNGLVSNTVPFTGGAGDTIVVSFRVPIVGWSSNVTMAESSTFRMSTILENGTRVTTTPTALGQYRSLIHTINTFVGTDSAPTSGWTPTTADGMRVAGSVAFNAAGTSGQPGRWEIFVGKNKNVRIEYYGAVGRTGQISTDFDCSSNDTINVGLIQGYDPATGVAWVDGLFSFAACTTRAAGRLMGSTGYTGNASSAYFDIIVSENALAVGVQSNRSTLRFNATAGNGTSGAGSTSTNIILWSTTPTEATGTAFSYNHSATLGTTITILEDGLYDVFAASYFGNGVNHGIYVSKNYSTNTSASSGSFPPANLVTGSYSDTIGAGATMRLHSNKTTFLPAGTVLRCHTAATGTPNGTATLNEFCISKVGN